MAVGGEEPYPSAYNKYGQQEKLALSTTADDQMYVKTDLAYPYKNKNGQIVFSHAFHVLRVTLLPEIELAYGAFCRQNNQYMHDCNAEMLSKFGIKMSSKKLIVCKRVFFLNT